MTVDTNEKINEADERTPEARRIEREAQAWLTLLNSGRATELDARALRRWRTESPLHREALVEAQRWWKNLDPALSIVRNENTVLADRLHARKRTPVWGRRVFLGGAAGLAAAAGVATVVGPLTGWSPVSDWNADYHTGAGEQRQLALADRVSVDLNTLTRINRERAGGQTVGIELVSGEAAVDLQGTGTAFTVTAGTGRSSARAGKFEVRHIDGKTCASCIEGELRIDHPAGTRVLGAGQQVMYDSRSLSLATPANLADLSSWRNGILVFRQTPLAEVIAEINRYRPGQVVLLSGELGSREVSGRFLIHALDKALLQIQHTYSLNARRLPGGLLILS